MALHRILRSIWRAWVEIRPEARSAIRRADRDRTDGMASVNPASAVRGEAPAEGREDQVAAPELDPARVPLVRRPARVLPHGAELEVAEVAAAAQENRCRISSDQETEMNSVAGLEATASERSLEM